MKTTVTNRYIPYAYLLTIRTYATWLHGDMRGSIDRKHNKYSYPKLANNIKLHHAMKKFCREAPFKLDQLQSRIVLQSIIDTCQHANWFLFAAHIRSNHLHILLSSEKPIDQVSVSLKAYATRDLKQSCCNLSGRKRFWAKHASTKYLHEAEHLFPAMQYVIEEQGKPMALYYIEQYESWKRSVEC